MEFSFFERKTPSGPVAVSLDELCDIGEEATGEGVKLIAFDRATGEKLYGTPVIEALVERRGQAWVLKANPSIRVDARSFKMSKSRGNIVNPDRIVQDYGADVFRLYEMYMGPLEAQKPWNTRDIVGMQRFLNRVWRTFVGDIDSGGPLPMTDDAIAPDLDRRLHRAIRKVGEDIEAMRFNTAIAELIELLNEASRAESLPRAFVRDYTLLLAPFAPHLAEEVWHRVLGNQQSVVLAPWPEYDPAKLVESSIEVPVQVNGKLRGKVTVPADADETAVLAAAEADVARHLDGKQVRKRVYVPGKMVNLVVG
jgi:leucyl-tRNA synthetase